MLPKVIGARRICYKDDEKYLITKENAMHIFPNIDDINEYADGSLLVIDSIDGIKYSVCASSDALDESILQKSKALSYENRIMCNPHHFMPLLIAIADLILNNIDIMDNDYQKYNANAGKSNETMIEYFHVFNAASEFLTIYIALNILKYGISGYAEAQGDTYHETRFPAEWGGSEERSGAVFKHSVSNEPQVSVLYNNCRNSKILYSALNSADWRDVPYIKIIAEIIKSGELAEMIKWYGVSV